MSTRRGLAAFAFFCCSLFGCGARQIQALEPVGDARGLHGRVQIERVEGQSRLYTVVLDRAVRPSEIVPNAVGYGAWVAKPGSAPQWAGLLEFIEQKRRGVVMFTSSLPAVELTITVETNSRPTTPSSTELFHQTLTRE